MSGLVFEKTGVGQIDQKGSRGAYSESDTELASKSISKPPAISGGFFCDWQKIDKGQGLIQPLKWTVFYKKHDIPAYCIYVS
jgi:hypothetical protein